MTHDEMIAVILAHKDGKEIQIRHRRGSMSVWRDAKCPSFDFDQWQYRIKPSPKLVPFTIQDWKAIIGEKIRRKCDHDSIRLICGVSEHQVCVAADWDSFGYVAFEYEFLDGTPCGKVVEE